MTKAHAAGLQMKWTQRGDPLPCEHLFQEPAHSDNGHFIAGLYYCIVCGQALKRPPPRRAKPPHGPASQVSEGV